MPPTDAIAGADDPRPRGGASATGYRSIAYFLPAALHARLKAAWWATRDEPEGAPSLAGLVEISFLREAEQLEQLYNEGEPFPPAPARAQGASRPTTGGYGHQTYYLPVALHARLKAAWWATRDEPEGVPSLAGLVEISFLREAEQLEQFYNEGEPFPPAPARARGISRAAAQRQGEWLRGEWERRRNITPTDEQG